MAGIPQMQLQQQLPSQQGRNWGKFILFSCVEVVNCSTFSLSYNVLRLFPGHLLKVCGIISVINFAKWSWLDLGSHGEPLNPHTG